MTLSSFYLICFLAGLTFSVLTFLLGAVHVHIHLPFHAHLPVHGGPVHVGHGAHTGVSSGSLGVAAKGGALRGGAQVSWFNASTIMAFLAWFGGAGYLLTRYSDVWPLAALFVALGIGWIGAALVFWFMAKVVWSPDENLDPDDFDVVGLLGTVSSPIRAGGTGEILFQLAGARHVAGARSEHGDAIGKGVEVVITRYENGLAYVRTWTELAADSQ